MFIVSALSFLIIATLASSVSALSKNCTEALSKLALTDAGHCFNIKGIVPLVTLDASASVVTPIDTWLQGLCYNGPSCNNNTLTNVGNTVTSACTQDLEDAGLPKNIVNRFTELIVRYYPPVVGALCVRNTNDTTPNQDFCTTYELNVLQSGIGQNLTTHNLISSIVNGLVGNATLSKSLVCTTCAEGAYAVVRPQLGNRTQQEVDAYFSGICGSSFQAASTPAGIIEATGSIATQTATPSPSHTTSKGAAASSLVRPLVSHSILAAFVSMMSVCLMRMGGMFAGL